MNKPVVLITMGDPAGIGPEIVCAALLEDRLHEAVRPVVIGSRQPLLEAIKARGLTAKLNVLSSDNIKENELEERSYSKEIINLIDVPIEHDFRDQSLLKENGNASMQYMYCMDKLIKKGLAGATASAPSNKEAMHAAGLKRAGATELLAELAEVTGVKTIISQNGCYIFQLTTHVPLRKALDMITGDSIFDYTMSVSNIMTELGIKNPKIGIAGLNPHAGDGGALGDEEQTVFIPAIERLRGEGINVSEPQPPDTIFQKGISGQYDALIILFHDMANAAIKLVSGTYPPVVITAGLPYVRTTVAHGTAYDVAYKGSADHKQFLEAVIAAGKILLNKK